VLGGATNDPRLTKLITAQTWWKPPPSPLSYVMCLAMGLAPKWHFVLGLPSVSPEIYKIETLTILGAHSLNVFQRYVARHLIAGKSG
jgi:hypothetical protein